MKFTEITYLCNLTFLISLAPLLGCGTRGDRPALGLVEGVVKLDGKPVSKATVIFKPIEGRESFGVTDQEGRYELVYIRDIKGAIIGSHKVSFLMPTNKSKDERQDNLRSELEREVQRGRNKFDFELGSKTTKN